MGLSVQETGLHDLAHWPRRAVTAPFPRGWVAPSSQGCLESSNPPTPQPLRLHLCVLSYCWHSGSRTFSPLPRPVLLCGINKPVPRSPWILRPACCLWLSASLTDKQGDHSGTVLYWDETRSCVWWTGLRRSRLPKGGLRTGSLRKELQGACPEPAVRSGL